jgi:hypothetical protein
MAWRCYKELRYFIFICGSYPLRKKIPVIGNSAINNTPDNKTRPPSMWNSAAQKMDQESPFLDIIYFLVR